MPAVVYKIKNIVNGRCYVGSSEHIAKRISTHKYYLRHGIHDNVILQCDWDKYGEDNFKFSHVKQVFDMTLLLTREQYWMNELKAVELGYNLSPTAGNQLGFRHSEETKQVISQKSKERALTLFTAEVRDKIRQSKLGHEVSLETRQKIREKLLGKSYITEEGRQRISESHRGKQRALGYKHTTEAKQRIGSHFQGSKNSRAKLTEADVIEIKKCLKNYRHGMLSELARKYGTSTHNIAHIRDGKSWKQIQV